MNINERMQQLAGIKVEEVTIDLGDHWGSITDDFSDRERNILGKICGELNKEFEDIHCNVIGDKENEKGSGINIAKGGKIIARVRKLNDNAVKKYKGKFVIHVEDTTHHNEKLDHDKSYAINGIGSIKARLENIIKRNLKKNDK